jgi:hypothetical protein
MSDLSIDNNIVDGVIAETIAAAPTHAELSAKLEVLNTELAELKVRHSTVMTQLRAEQNTTFEDKLHDAIKSFVRVAVEDAMGDLDINTEIENYLDRHIDDYVRNAVEDLSFEVTVR